MKSVLYLLYPLAGTILLESLAAFVMGLRGKKEYLLLALVNGVTNPFVVVLTKADKLSRSKQDQQRARLAKQFGLDRSQFVVTSSETGLGMDTLRRIIEEACE